MWGRRAEVSWGRYAGGQSPRTQDTQLSRCGMGGPRRQPLRHWLEVGGVGPPMQPPVSAQLSHPPHNDSRGFLRGQLSMAAGKVPDRFHLCRGWTQQSAAEGVCACVRAHPCTGHTHAQGTGFQALWLLPPWGHVLTPRGPRLLPQKGRALAASWETCPRSPLLCPVGCSELGPLLPPAPTLIQLPRASAISPHESELDW